MADHPGSHGKSVRRRSKPTQGARDKPTNKFKPTGKGTSTGKFITKGSGSKPRSRGKPVKRELPTSPGPNQRKKVQPGKSTKPGAFPFSPPGGFRRPGSPKRGTPTKPTSKGGGGPGKTTNKNIGRVARPGKADIRGSLPVRRRK